MKRINTKADRLEILQSRFKHYNSKGYAREDYKDLILFTGREEYNGRQSYVLVIYKGTSTNPLINCRFSDADRMLKTANNYKRSAEQREKYKAEQRAKGQNLSEPARCAAAIKEELSKKFSGVKFSVRSEIFSMGDAVRISWQDGPSADDVETITVKYQRGHFDGMTDMYEYSNKRSDIPQSKYITTNRKMSDATRAILDAAFEDLNKQWESSNRYSKERAFNIIWHKTSIPSGATVTGIERTEETCGLLEDLYRISYTLPAQANTEKEALNYEKVEATPGQVQIIDYSEKALAVVGDTRPIKDKLKSLGGKFNFRLSCGAGWIFPKSKLSEIQKALAPNPESLPEDITAEEERAIPETVADKIQKTVQWFAETDKKLFGEITEGTKEAARVQRVEIEEPETFNYVG